MVVDCVDFRRISIKPHTTRPEQTYVCLDGKRLIMLYEGTRVLSFAFYPKPRKRINSAHNLYGYRNSIRAVFGCD